MVRKLLRCTYDGRTDAVAKFYTDSTKFTVKLDCLFGQSLLPAVGEECSLNRHSISCVIVNK